MIGYGDEIKLMLRMSNERRKNELCAHFKCQNNFFEKYRKYLPS